MAIKLIANYSKRLGLPGFSSHQFSVSVETELVATDDIATESRLLYEMLQSNVDEQIEQSGFVPAHDYGMSEPVTNRSRLPWASQAREAAKGRMGIGRWSPVSGTEAPSSSIRDEPGLARLRQAAARGGSDRVP